MEVRKGPKSNSSGQRIMESSAFMSGNNPGLVAASRSSSNCLIGVDMESGIFFSTLLTEILISALTPTRQSRNAVRTA
jgi:hypothetical protein